MEKDIIKPVNISILNDMLKEQEQKYEKRIAELEKENKILLKNNSVNQWAEMYNRKDKECFNYQLRMSKAEVKIKKIQEYCKYFKSMNENYIVLDGILEIIKGE